MTDRTQPVILVVDDSPVNLKFVFTALQRANFTIVSAENGEDGLVMAKDRQPDLILLDVMMPGIDGFEVCERLKADPATRSIPVIFMTALSDSVDKVKGFEVGGDDYVTKPVDVPEVIARIHTQLKIYNLQQDLHAQNQRLVDENQKRKRVQDALRESRWRYRLLAENSTDIISRQTLVGVYLYVSPACTTLLGYTMEEVIGTSALDYIHPDDLDTVKAVYVLRPDCPSTHTATYRARRKDGSFVWLETINKTVCDTEFGQPYEIVAVSRDVTERVELAEQLRMQNQELDAFAHTVAHDLKNPLATIISYADFMLAMWARLDDERLQDSVSNIRGTSQKGLYIIDELMLLASVRRGHVELEPLDMTEIVEQVQERLQLMIDEYQAQLILPDEWPLALGYSAWVEEVWINYLSNGLKYGGRPPALELGATPASDGTVRFWVKDNGSGLSAQEQKRLFAEFVRLDEIRIEGHGLGLSIVRRIVEKLGGEVGIESEAGQGSTFWFSLPAVDQPG
ncbi:MAG: Sensor histidine kinase TmoS [Anaerolineae bacterium]|nr:Sensor histidine kinase TmoS [Anaerolineae bacterium]